MDRVRPAAPVAPWLGGKKRLHPTIIERIEAIPHKTYCEPFVGMSGVFLRRHFRPKLEGADDRNGEIVDLFRILRCCQTNANSSQNPLPPPGFRQQGGRATRQRHAALAFSVTTERLIDASDDVCRARIRKRIVD